MKTLRKLKKKLRQIEELEEQAPKSGVHLIPEQQHKIAAKADVIAEIAALEQKHPSVAVGSVCSS